jgi:fructose-specific phosphotransferase system component IIB
MVSYKTFWALLFISVLVTNVQGTQNATEEHDANANVPVVIIADMEVVENERKHMQLFYAELEKLQNNEAASSESTSDQATTSRATTSEASTSGASAKSHNHTFYNLIEYDQLIGEIEAACIIIYLEITLKSTINSN